MAPRTGRRPGSTETRQRILDAARRLFADNGYDGTTIREIARQAGVDPALVHHFYADKDHIFAAAVRFPFTPAEVFPGVLEGDPSRVGERVVRFFLSVLGDLDGRDAFFGLVRSVSTNEQAAAMLREFVTREVLARVTAALGTPRLRVEAAAAQLVGLAMLRYVIRVEPLASAGEEEVVALFAPTLQRYLTGE